MKRLFQLLLFAPLVVTLAQPAYSQGDYFNNRERNQERRTQKAKKNHKMSADEQARADERTYKAESEENRMRGEHKGKLTRHDRRKLNRQLNRNSRRIRNESGN